MRYSAPRGTRDIKEREALAFRELETVAGEIFSRYGYQEIRTPVFESAELFQRAVGEATDIVEKEMYVFEDRGGRSLALRPEGTAGVVRAYLEHAWDKTGGTRKLFYSGPMFRAERPQAGRYREFWQLGAEFFGNASPQADADMLLLIRDILVGYGLDRASFFINSLGCAVCRPEYRARLTAFLSERRDRLCVDCQRRWERNPLRCLDCKVDGPSLQDAPLMQDSLCEACRAHDKELESLLNSVNFPYQRAPRMVRGLDYYTRTVFEITASGLGAQDALGAGGRYDGLVKQMGGPDVPAVGFALGMDRVARVRYGDDLSQDPLLESAGRIFVALTPSSTGATGMAGFKILQDLRHAGFTAEIGSAEKSLKAQLRWADGWKAGFVVIVGEEELSRGMVQLKNLGDHSQKEFSIGAIVSALRESFPRI